MVRKKKNAETDNLCDFDIPEIDMSLCASASDLTGEPDKGSVAAVIDPAGPRLNTLSRRAINVYRRAWSELNLLDALPAEMLDGHSYHCISGGDVDSLSYLKHILRQQPLAYCLLSTWCMADDDTHVMAELVSSGRIGRLDVYVGEIFPGSYAGQWEAMKQVVRPVGGRVAVFRNHAKIFAGMGPKFSFGIESSANINTNPRAENACITIGDDIFEFYKAYFDGIKSYMRDFDDWKPWRGV